MTRLGDQVLADFRHCLKRTTHFLHLRRNLVCTEACLYALHHELKKTPHLKQQQKTIPEGFLKCMEIISLCSDSCCPCSMDICTHLSLWYVKHPPAEIQALKISWLLSWSSLHIIFDSPTLSILSRHLSIFYSQSDRNANPNALKLFFTYILLLLCYFTNCKVHCFSISPCYLCL